MTLLELPVNSVGILEKVEGDATFVRRLYDLGFYPGCRVKLKKRFSQGGSVVVGLQATSFSMRWEEAERLIVRAEHA